MLKHPTAPPGCHDVAAEGLRRLLAHGDMRRRLLGDTPPATLQITDPHGVHTLRARHVDEGVDLADAPRDAWRLLVFSGDDPVAAIELHETDEPPGFTLAHINSGRIVQATVEAIDAAERHDDVLNGDFELRFLRVPELSYAAVWLHGGTDLFVTIDGHPGPQDARGVVDLRTVLGELGRRRARN